ncbi:TetR/AcrR family transcriptional regulator [Yinghuangia seranimata]|uniref:TetR/AcrR family transcriptional regulator n=1 Tax=Yinghuangia seranimata TaxID=408067 RepID=UPI00248A944C|nr:TetR/AcrR family transcriptional regulator [Yinghuangia seranimata]MDI2132141.1 TetR/AcrR family transcriptional regulator [Yinghuangia seranimata]
MPVPYESTGRSKQKARTREALVTAARALIADGGDPTVEQAAAAAGISRTTAYRYFPNQHSLLTAAHPEIEYTSLLPDDAPPDDPYARLDLVMAAFARITTEWEPQLRAALRLSLTPAATPEVAQRPPLRQGRAIAWITDALTPLRTTHPDVDVHRLAVAIRAATGIESLVWLTDIAGLTRPAAVALMRDTARALLRAALNPEH